MISQHVVATSRGNRRLLEERSGLQTFASGYDMVDPSAVPPPGAMGHHQRAGVIVTAHSLLQVDVVFTALRVITTAVLKMGDPRAYTQSLSPDNIPYRNFSKKQPPLLSDTFGGRMMQYDGRRRTIMSMGLFGEAFWYVLARDSRAYAAALDVLHPAFMEIKSATAQDVFEGKARHEGDPMYLYGSGVNRKLLDPDDVVHIPFMAMPQARRALSSVEYAGVSGALAMAAYEFGSMWFSQGAAPSFLLSTDQKLGQAEVDRIAQKFAIEHSGLQSAHLPLVLDSGLKAEKLMSSPDEAQYLNTLEYARSVIASWFGIPTSLIGNALVRESPMPPNTLEEETERFLQYTLSGYTIPLEEAYSSLLPEGQLATFDDSQLIRPNTSALAQLVLNLRQSNTLLIDEIRTRWFGLGPLPDGQGQIAMAPLASNTAPSQTPDAKSAPKSAPAEKPPPAKKAA
jgi:HK97 family phage portal protein